MRIRLSASQVAAADNCRRLHWYQSIAKVQARAVPANLAFGQCIDEATREYLRALATDSPLPDPVAAFQALWRKKRDSAPLTYASTQTPEIIEQIGLDLMRSLPSAWDRTGFQVALDSAGAPLLDRWLRAGLGTENGIELELTGVIDVVVYTADLELAVVDVKSAAAAHTALYAMRSDQLTVYQILLSAHQAELGLPPLVKLGFWDFLKRKASSRIEPPLLVPVRTAAELREFRQKCFWIADDVRRKRFPKVSRMQFNTPCELCDYAQHCVYGDADGLAFPASARTTSA